MDVEKPIKFQDALDDFVIGFIKENKVSCGEVVGTLELLKHRIMFDMLCPEDRKDCLFKEGPICET